MRRVIVLGVVAAAAWTVLMVAIFVAEESNEDHWLRDVAGSQARALYQQIVDTRSWNSAFGGVYVPATDSTPPNPYLDMPERDLVTTEGKRLTLINHAHMTRQIAEIGFRRHDVTLHLTSLNPLRPQNAPRDWEVGALTSFENGGAEYSTFGSDWKGDPEFRFMAPLRVERSCLACHAAQGYEEGRIRGGLAVVVPEKSLMHAHAGFLRASNLAFVVIWLMGIGIIWLLTRGFLARQRLVSRLEDLSLSDELTGLCNRRGFLTHAEQQIRIARRLGCRILLFFIDVDGMKQINDRFGHGDGDVALTRVATILTAAFRDSDVIARLGGDEFAVLYFDTMGSGPTIAEGRLRRLVERDNAEQPGPWSLSVSVGVAEIDPGFPIEIEDALDRADRLMYLQKGTRRSS